jgi:hypothetical protein
MPGLRVRRAEGRRFVARQTSAAWDAIVIDAFSGALLPRSLITVQALADVARVAPLALINVVDDRRAHEVRAVAAALLLAYPYAWAVGGRGGNTIVAGSRARLDLDRIGAGRPTIPRPRGSPRPSSWCDWSPERSPCATRSCETLKTTISSPPTRLGSTGGKRPAGAGQVGGAPHGGARVRRRARDATERATDRARWPGRSLDRPSAAA